MNPERYFLRISGTLKTVALISFGFLLEYGFRPEIFLSVISFVSFYVLFVYIINDIIDVEEDRKNSFYKNRPLVSGKNFSFVRKVAFVYLFLFSVSLPLLKSQNILILFIISLIYYPYNILRLKENHTLREIINISSYFLKALYGATFLGSLPTNTFSYLSAALFIRIPSYVTKAKFKGKKINKPFLFFIIFVFLFSVIFSREYLFLFSLAIFYLLWKFGKNIIRDGEMSYKADYILSILASLIIFLSVVI